MTEKVGGPVAEHFSTRARVLGKILPFISREDWADYGEYIVFGESAFQKLGFSSEDRAMSRKDENTLHEMTEAAQRFTGNRLSRERTSLGSQADHEQLRATVSESIQKLSPEVADKLTKAWLNELDKRKSLDSSERSDVLSGEELDDLDYRYSEEVLEKLEQIVRRAGSLEQVKLERIPNQRVQVYFEEAHRCYLYGFRVACAVLCRSILESCLKEIVDPNDQLRLSKGKESSLLALYALADGSVEQGAMDKMKSHIRNMVYKAKKDGLLQGPSAGWAIEIKDAGNAAIHDVEKFERNFSDQKVEEILLHTRKVLRELYSGSAEGKSS